MLSKISIKTVPGESLVDITKETEQILRDSGVEEGICVLNVPHTTAGLTINSTLDPATRKDIINELHQLVPSREDFEHTFDTPADAAGHIKSTLVATTLSVIVTEGRLLLGHSQGIFFYEFDGARPRNIFVRVMEEKLVNDD